MANTYVKNDIHLVFHVKPKTTLMLADDLAQIFSYMAGIVKGTGAKLYRIGGMPDHVHILLSLPKTMALSDFVRTLKSESSKWLKTLNPYYGGFCWQEGYGAFSVSVSLMDKTIHYIDNQASHHQVRTFMDEYKQFLKANGIEYDERFL